MRAAVAFILGLAVLPLAAGSSPPSAGWTFQPPADLQGNMDVENGTWAVFFFKGASAFDLASEADQQIIEHSYPMVDGEASGVAGLRNIDSPQPINTTVDAAARLGLGFGSSGPGYLLLKADGLALSVDRPATGQLLGLSDLYELREHLPSDLSWRNPFWVDYGGPASPNGVLTAAAAEPTSFTLKASGVRSAIWFGAQVDCAESQCPSGGGWQAQEFSAPLLQVAAGSYDYEEAFPVNGTFSGQGMAEALAIGGDRLDVFLDGTLRLPGARMDASCPKCLDPSGSTFAAEGNLTLAGLRFDSAGGRMAAAVGGDIEAARFDEASIDPSALLGISAVAGVAAAVGLGWLLKVLGGSLFTRRKDVDVLDLPNRRTVYDAVLSNPGISFRELTRTCGLAVGTTRHHLNILLRHGKIVQREHGGALAFFSPSDAASPAWSAMACLRDPELRVLHEMLRERPGIAQKELIAAGAERNWTRTATQARLARLEAQGLAKAVRQGRRKLYWLQQPGAA